MTSENIFFFVPNIIGMFSCCFSCATLELLQQFENNSQLLTNVYFSNIILTIHGITLVLLSAYVLKCFLIQNSCYVVQ
jgi:hypothetical protein